MLLFTITFLSSKRGLFRAALNQKSQGDQAIQNMEEKNQKSNFIKITSNSFLLPNDFTQQRDRKSNSEINIVNTFFNKILSDNYGGAVSIKSAEYTVCVANCIYKECFAKISGGGIYIMAYNGTIQKTTFSDCICHTIYSGQAFFASLKNIHISHSSVIRCSPDITSNGYESSILMGGVQKVYCFNSSNNIAKNYASGFLSAESTSIRLSKLNICNNSSPNQIIALTHVRPDDKISDLNIIENKKTKDGLIYMSGAFIIFNKASFFYNEGPFLCFTVACGPAFMIIENSYSDYLPEHIFRYRSVLRYTNSKTNCSSVITFPINIVEMKNSEIMTAGERLIYE